MENEKLFINKRYIQNLEGKYTLYMSRNGVLKKVINNPLFKRVMNDENTWYDLSELPQELQNELVSMSITASDLQKSMNKSKNKDRIIDSEQVTVYVKENTPILPVVGNILPNDGTHAYTVIYKNGIPTLKPIVICFDCHWSELFTGQTTYGNNVFCLVSELSKDQREQYIDEIITLRDASKYLEQCQEKTKSI